MDPTLIASSVLRGATSATAKVVANRYQPAGVPRTGSPEDRGAAYRTFLDAAIRRMRTLMRVHDVLFSEEITPPAQLSLDLHAQWVATDDDFLCALTGIRLCGAPYVIEAAERLFQILEALPARGDGHDDAYDDEAYQRSLQDFRKAQWVFLEAARHDLAYNPRWWQLLRKYSERQYRKKHQATIEVTGPAPGHT
jgi:hypothetical protein